MADEQRRGRGVRKERNRDRWGAVLVVGLAVVAGVVAGATAHERAWERPSSTQSPTTSAGVGSK